MEEDFFLRINKFNEIYGIENHYKPTLLDVKRLENFKHIISDEIAEVDAIIEKYKQKLSGDQTLSEEKKLELLTDVSDWLGDIVVYATSEARRFGIDLKEILHIIMESNFSKLDTNGKPILDERGKILKGPNYWKPEPKISELLKENSKNNLSK